ncbi:uncharacterized protein LOC106133809 isoform X2 [Amyelois transitella]|uniref:uncharacterized protein LOC106133809 isoform X2 n=1 Tax=Amyelois transitella TaxID=680683 RepID=UPI00298F9356|nr:uncharacterized protein LOC106133809 isoform X2 [Amyelois transitella]
MDSRKEMLKKSLGISEYPWSSDDDDDNETTIPLNLVQRGISDVPRPSLGEIPGTSSQPPPATFSPSDSPARKAQAKMDREMFWSLITNHRALTRVNNAGMPNTLSGSRLAATAPSSVERRELRPDRTSAEVQRKLARLKSRDEFVRFTKSLQAMRNSRHNNNVYPIYARSASAQSRNPLFSHCLNQDVPLVKTNVRAHIPKRLYASRPDCNSRNQQPMIAVCGGHGISGPPPTLSVPHQDLPVNPAANENTETFNIDLSDDEFVIPPKKGMQSAPTTERRDGNPFQDISDDIIEEMCQERPSGAPPAVPPPPDAVDGAGQPASEVDSNYFETATKDIPNVFPDWASLNVWKYIMCNKKQEALQVGSAVPSTSQQIIQRKKRDESEDGSELPSVKEFNQSLLRLLECPVCLEWMEPPIAQCRRGHLVCTGCRARLAACPVCRTTFSSVRNRAMEGVSELLRYPCRHGCGREMRLRKRGPHEASCPARRFACPAAACQHRAPLLHTDLTHHFQSKHLDIMKIGRKHKFSMKVNSEHHDDWIIMALHEMFHLRVDVDVRNWGVVFYVVYIGPKARAKKFMYNITINGQHNSRKLSYARLTHSDLERPSLNENRQDCFHLTLDQTVNFLRCKNRHCDPDKYLDFNVEIAKTEDDEENKESQET